MATLPSAGPGQSQSCLSLCEKPIWGFGRISRILGSNTVFVQATGNIILYIYYLYYIYIFYIYYIYICCILFLLSNPWTDSLWTSTNEARIITDVTQDRSIRCQCRPDLPAVLHEHWRHAALTTLKLNMKDVAWAEVKKSPFALERSCRAEDHSNYIITTWWPDSRKWTYGDSHIHSDLPYSSIYLLTGKLKFLRWLTGLDWNTQIVPLFTYCI